MAGVEVGPNDIVIHLVNPYRCGDCGAEFSLRRTFSEHVADHIATLKSDKPCHQIVCVASVMEHAPKGITITRDILQINDQQLFELQDSSLDYTQLSSLKVLEQAGILKLPPPKRPQAAMPILVSEDVVGEGGKRQVSLLKHQQGSLVRQAAVSSKFKELTKELVGEGQLVTLTGEAGGEIHYVSSDFSDPKFLDTIVQEAMLDTGQTVKVEGNGFQVNALSHVATVANPQEPLIVSGDQLLMALKENDQKEEMAEKFITGAKRRAAVKSPASLAGPVGSLEFPTANAVEIHRSQAHLGSSPLSCPSCLKSFRGARALKKHRLIHQRQHICPVCHRTYQRRAQLIFHMRHHNRQRFIQFGSNFHEVRVISGQNKEGQVVQEHYLLLLLSKEEQRQLALERAGDQEIQKKVELDDGSPAVPRRDKQLKPETKDASFVSGTIIHEKKTVCKSAAASVEQDDKCDENMRNTANSSPSRSAQAQINNSMDALDLPALYESEPGDLKKKIIYRCGHCKKIIFTLPALSRHLIKHTNSKPFQCDKCLRSFSEKADLRDHNWTHIKPVQCPMCRSNFSKAHYLRNHLSTGCPRNPSDNRIVVLEDKRCLCKICQKVLKSKINAFRHLRIHDFQKRAKVKAGMDNSRLKLKVQISPNLSQNVEDHYKPLGSSVGFQCLLCGEELRFKSFMVTHVRRHLNQRLFKCDQCPKSFFARHILRKHQQNHTRPYKCPVCGKGFIRRYMMSKHFAKRHDLPEGVEDPMKDITELPDLKLIQCNICGKTMKQSHKSVMLYHIRLHKDVRPFKCDECLKSFISENALKKHSLTHSKPYVCQVCKTGFSRRYLLTDHFKKTCILKLGKTADEICSASSFSTLSQVQSNGSTHKSTQSEGLVDGHESQDNCAEDFNRIKHLHPSANEYICEPCNKKFTVFETYIRHMKTFSKPTACKYCKKLFEDKHDAVAHQRSCLGTITCERADTFLKEQNSVASGDWLERVKLMEEVNKTIQLASADTGVDDSQLIQSSPTPSKQAKMDSTPQASTLKRTVEALRCQHGKYQCPQCNRVFSTPRGLKIHASVHIRLFKCEVCALEFKTIRSLRAHSKKHGENTEFLEIGENREDIEELDRLDETSYLEKSGRKDDKKVPANMKTDIEIDCPTPTSSKLKGSTKTCLTSVSLASGKETGDLDTLCIEQEKDNIESTNSYEGGDMLLMQQGTRGRPYRCQLCRKRFTERQALDNHMSSAHKQIIM